MNDLIAALTGMRSSYANPNQRRQDRYAQMYNAAMQQAMGPAYQAAMSQMLQQRASKNISAYLGPNIFSGPLAGLGPVMRHPTEREIAEAELKAFLGDDLWNMAWLRL